jgi:hypothetical protein
MVSGNRSAKRWVGLACIALYGLIAFPSLSGIGGVGLDASWVWTLNLLQPATGTFGHDVVFAYGPLGYLLRPLESAGHFGAGLALLLFQHCVVLAASIVVIRRDGLRPVIFFLAAMLSLSVLQPETDYRDIAVISVACAASISFSSRLGLVLCTAISATMLFMKFSSGIVASSILVLSLLWFAVAWRQWRFSSICLAIYGVSLLAMAQLYLTSVANLPSYLGLSSNLSAGYNGAMFLPGPCLEVILGIVAVLMFFSLGIYLARRRSRAAPSVGIMSVAVALAFKHSFVRHDVGHAPFVFEAILIGCALVLLLAHAWADLIAASLVLLFSAASALIVVHEGGRAVRAVAMHGALTLEPVRYAVKELFDHTGRTRARRSATDSALERDKIPAEWRREIIEGGQVMVLPSETAICPANDLGCIPFPTLQMYACTTSSLDQWASRVLSGRAPTHILSAVDAIDGENMLWGTPAVWETLLGRYEVRRIQSEPAPGKVLLRRRQVERRWTHRELGTVQARGGDWVNVPSSHPWLRAHIYLRENAEGALRRSLFRPQAVITEIRYKSGREESWRLVIQTAVDGIWVNAPVARATDLASWFEGTPMADPVQAIRLTGSAMSDYYPVFKVDWVDMADSG